MCASVGIDETAAIFFFLVFFYVCSVGIDETAATEGGRVPGDALHTHSCLRLFVEDTQIDATGDTRALKKK